MKRKRAAPVIAAGDELKVVADCGIRNDDDSSVPSVELRGHRVTAAGVNCEYDHAETGERMVAAELENGFLTAIPRRALRHARTGASVGSTSRFRRAWAAIFDTD